MNKVISFISGKEYSLADLFGGDTKIIIPDLQRDYCWGNYAVTDRKSSKTKELVSDFVKNIVELFEEKSDSSLTMGLIYGYEQPHIISRYVMANKDWLLFSWFWANKH